MYSIGSEIVAFLPQLILGGEILVFLMGSLFLKDKKLGENFLGRSMVWILGGLGILVLLSKTGSSQEFKGLFFLDSYTRGMQFLGISATLCVWVALMPSLKIEKLLDLEFCILILLGLLGMLIMITSNNFMPLYLGMELQSMTLYILVALKKNSLKANEAAVKYFILGALASVIFLFGVSLIYGTLGSLNFQEIAQGFTKILKEPEALPLYVVGGGGLGFLCILCGLLFKLGVAPFHAWVPDVYEGVPFPLAAFLALVPKIAVWAVFLRLWGIFFSKEGVLGASQAGLFFSHLMMGAAIFSIALGIFGALGQTNIKRLLAYSSISHMGFILLGVSLGTSAGTQAAFLYLFAYLIMGIGLFSCLCNLRYPLGHARMGIIEDLVDLKGLSKTRPGIALALAVLLFSFAGIPPLIGFFSKIYLLLSFLGEGFIGVSIFIGLVSVIGAFYYLRIIKYLYFEDTEIDLEGSFSPSSLGVLIFSLGVTVFFFLYSQPLLWCVKFMVQPALQK